MKLRIRIDGLTGSEIAALLEEHIEDMRSVSPPESKHALDLEGLRQADIRFWTVWDGEELVGCGALKRLDAAHGEIKSMRSSREARGKGIGQRMLEHVIESAREMGMQRLSLETGSMPFFAPARGLYRKFGFVECGPFASYVEDPNSVFMTKEL